MCRLQNVNKCSLIVHSYPDLMLAELKLLADKRDVPYQSLIEIILAERLEEELESREN